MPRLGWARAAWEGAGEGGAACGEEEEEAEACGEEDGEEEEEVVGGSDAAFGDASCGSDGGATPRCGDATP